MTPPRDPFDPDHPPPHWRDADGNFGGWLTEAEVAAQEVSYADLLSDEEPSDEDDTTDADMLAANDADDDDWVFF
jgi:hypothetical protein